MMRARVPLCTALLAVALLLITNAGFAASFDCTKARSQVEKLVCADPLLGQLDETLALNYGAMLTVDLGRSAQSVRAEQLGWVARRNRCKDVPCLVEAYKARVDETCEYGVAAGVHPICSLAEDVMAQHVQAKTTGPGDCQLTEREMLGHWSRTSRSGFHEEMAFESDAGSRRFDSWLHGRPEFSGGSWSLENCAIHIRHPSLRSLDSTLHVLSYRKGVLSLRDQRTQQAVVYVRMP
jgi:uncharacterized protein